MSRMLPARPSLEHLRKQAKALLRALAAGDPDAAAAFGPRAPGAPPPRLADAQHALARTYGFANWAALKQQVEVLAGPDAPASLAAAIRLNDASAVRDVLARFPALRARLDDPLDGGDFGETPLIAAARRANLEIVDLLLDAGADIDRRSHWWAGGFSALGDDPAVNAHLMARGATVDAFDAARLGMMDRVRDLVMLDPSVVQARFGDGQTPLHAAATVEVADFLLDHGADIDAQDVDHESTAAQYLIRRCPEVARRLVARGCRADLLLACALGDVNLARRLLDANPACIAMTVSPRWFPMRHARAGGTIYLWTLGPGKTAHGLARDTGNAALVALLMERTPPPLQLAVACEFGDASRAARLRADHPGLLSTMDAELLGRLPGAARRGDLRAVRLMLDAGWPPSTADEFGATALHWAAYGGHAEMVRDLLGRGADSRARERRFDGTPRDWAAHAVKAEGRAGEGLAAVLELLPPE